MLCRCYTFNQAPYIEDALNGFIMQQTDFPFVCLVIDDCSTDGEQAVIKAFLDRECDMDNVEYYEDDTTQVIYVQHKTNANCYMAVYLLKENLYKQKARKTSYVTPWRDHCEYEALCEGDDYWIDPLKLQKQVNVMEKTPNCMLTFHSVFEKFEDDSSRDHVRATVEEREYSGIEWYSNRPSQYASFMVNPKIYSDEFYMNKIIGKFPAGDIPLLLSCYRLGSIIGLSEVMSVYRRNEGGWTTQFRSPEQSWHVIKSHLKYSIFGKEYANVSRFLYQRDCVGYFVNCLKHRKLCLEFLNASLKVSVIGTIRCFILILRRRYV